MARKKVPQSARLRGGIQSLFGQCPNLGGDNSNGPSLTRWKRIQENSGEVNIHSAGKVVNFPPFDSLEYKTAVFPSNIRNWDNLSKSRGGCQVNLCPRAVCTPRPERLPEGEAQGQSPGPRDAKSMLWQISRSEGGIISNGSQLSSV